ncbi:MAG TPA: N-acyl homoserine lactonase family protein [Puia sp.]|nr:N-acyl homoserine lactonase family protein [Puia sp.]
MFAPASIHLTSAGRPVALHLFSTGQGKDKCRFMQARFLNSLSLVDSVLDRRFTDWLPIWVMVIQHPEGIFVIDTGERAEVSDPAWFKTAGSLSGWLVGSQFKFSVTRDEEIDRQLTTIGLSPGEITAVILTHLHFDHTDGLYHFPAAQVRVARPEWERPFGALPKLYPSWFKPTLLDLDQSIGPFQKAAWLTSSQDLALVHTPGHTYGHCSILLRADTHHVLFAGDICYTQRQLLDNRFAANAASYRLGRQTYAAVKTYARGNRLVFLPSHDPDAGNRLRDLQVLPIS